MNWYRCGSRGSSRKLAIVLRGSSDCTVNAASDATINTQFMYGVERSGVSVRMGMNMVRGSGWVEGGWVESGLGVHAFHPTTLQSTTLHRILLDHPHPPALVGV